VVVNEGLFSFRNASSTHNTCRNRSTGTNSDHDKIEPVAICEHTLYIRSVKRYFPRAVDERTKKCLKVAGGPSSSSFCCCCFFFFSFISLRLSLIFFGFSSATRSLFEALAAAWTEDLGSEASEPTMIFSKMIWKGGTRGLGVSRDETYSSKEN
jgi:hypothetical protein